MKQGSQSKQFHIVAADFFQCAEPFCSIKYIDDVMQAVVKEIGRQAFKKMSKEVKRMKRELANKNENHDRLY